MSTVLELEQRNNYLNGNDENGLTDDPVQKQTTLTAIGKTKTFVGLDKEEWIFITLSVLNFMVAIGFTIARMTQIPTDTPDFTFAVILIINAVFCVFYAIHGVLREREFEIYAYIAAIIIVFSYVLINLVNNPEKRNAVKWARFGTILLFAPFNIYYGIVVARGFGFLEFRIVGAAVTLQKMYRRAGIFSCLLKFDFQLALSLAVLVIYNPASWDGSEILIVSVGIPFQLAWSIFGWLTLRKEVKYLLFIFIPASLVEPGYISYQIYMIHQDWSAKTKNCLHDTGNCNLVFSFFLAAGLALLVRILVLCSLKFVVDNFGKGLRESVYNIPDADHKTPLLPRKRDIAQCCGVVCCGPLG
ncbi:uncharacterized protein LOC116304889 [Actinia tenebrosa]|uniref:Uncharacterized protein LOC116304889 n=1 Tax=Actinia tenebrosa TaxID=6105 RepID=A0A6P8IUD3_ACTTE|nr:uncharacterized protein LOC116304889 [Actinia tenebrosa]